MPGQYSQTPDPSPARTIRRAANQTTTALTNLVDGLECWMLLVLRARCVEAAPLISCNAMEWMIGAVNDFT